MRKIANFILFQAGWFAAVGGAARGRPGLGAAAVCVLWVIHDLFVCRERPVERRMAVIALLCGVIVDPLQRALGLIDWGGSPIAPLPPLWLWFLWPLFTTTFNLSMAWLRGRYGILALFGFLGGPLSYFAGVRMGAITFGRPWMVAMPGIGAVWAAVTPLLFFVNERLLARGFAMRSGSAHHGT